MNLLLVEDNETIAKGLKYFLEQSGFLIDYKSNIKTALEQLEMKKYNLIILDITLPDGNGFDLFKVIQEKYNTKVIFLTAKDEEDNIVHGLEIGAEDYITKPFKSKELLARINKVLLKNNSNLIKVRDITLDIDKMLVYKNDLEINLTALEFKILELLFINLNKVVTRDSIINKIWELTGNDVNDNTVTVYMKRIREKLDTNIITTIKKIGYRADEK